MVATTGMKRPLNFVEAVAAKIAAAESSGWRRVFDAANRFRETWRLACGVFVG
jgi:hypothetical protein